jgi:hypothetical protein
MKDLIRHARPNTPPYVTHSELSEWVDPEDARRAANLRGLTLVSSPSSTLRKKCHALPNAKFHSEFMKANNSSKRSTSPTTDLD